jgi:hypothetical protein
MDNQEYQAHFTGEIVEPEAPEEFEATGRYDNEGELGRLLREAFELRMACQAQSHKLGDLQLNLSTNVMKCSRCLLEFDLNELVAPELRVPRRVA